MKTLLTSRDVAELLGVTQARVNQFARSGRLRPARTIGRSYVYHRADVLAFRKRPRPNGRPRK